MMAEITILDIIVDYDDIQMYLSSFEHLSKQCMAFLCFRSQVLVHLLP